VHELALAPLLPLIVQQPSEFAVGHELTTLPPPMVHWLVKLLVSPAPETPVQTSAPAVIVSQ
jgi:hypothetical protein